MTDLTEATLAAFGNKTRGRILRESLGLFNTHGFEAVTTAQIAQTSEVLDGTLWYHFKAKQDLVFAHLAVLENELEKLLSSPVSDDLLLIGEHFLQTFALTWDFRYLLRGPLQALEEYAGGKQRLQAIYRLLEDKTKERLIAANNLGYLDVPDTEIDSLAINSVLVGRYCLDYARIRYSETEDSERDRHIGIELTASLVRPYYTQKTQDLLEQF